MRSSFAASLAVTGLVIAMVSLTTASTGCLNTSCRAQDVRGTNMRCGGGARGFMWTGTGCIFTVACNCAGQDCQRLYATQESCETAHIHCH